MKGKRSYGLFRNMRYRDTTHRKNTCIWYANYCDRCGEKNGWVTRRMRMGGFRKYGACWLCGKEDFLNVGPQVDHWSMRRYNRDHRDRRKRRR
jgi:hypothetical protein